MERTKHFAAETLRGTAYLFELDATLSEANIKPVDRFLMVAETTGGAIMSRMLGHLQAGRTPEDRERQKDLLVAGVMDRHYPKQPQV